MEYKKLKVIVEYADGHSTSRSHEAIALWTDETGIEIDGITYIQIMSHTFRKISDTLYIEV